MTARIGGFFGEQPQGLHVAHVRSTAYYALQIPEKGIGLNTTALLVLHGWGQNARSFIRKFAPLVRQDILVIAPQAPHQFYLDIETRKVGFGWMTSFDRDRAIADVVAGLDAILDAVEAEHETGPLRPCVLGFSQGVSIAWRYAIHGDRDVAGVVACGGDLPPDVEHVLSTRKPIPALLVHGREDAIVPWSKAESAELVLREQGYLVETNYFDGGHDLPAGLMERLSGWTSEAVHPSESRGEG